MAPHKVAVAARVCNLMAVCYPGADQSAEDGQGTCAVIDFSEHCR